MAKLCSVLRFPRKYINYTSLLHHRSLHTSHRYDSESSNGMENAPLAGIRVMDMTRILAGPYCTMLLGDLGAEVIKIERPGVGDDTRSWGPPWVGKESAYYLSVNRNKKSITLDLKSNEGWNVATQLAEQCDVLVENFVPGTLDKLGLGYEQLKKFNKRLIYVSISGFGTRGPLRERAGYNDITAAMYGLMHITGPQGGDPCRVGVAMTDLSTGLYAYGAIMAALIHRQKTGTGQHIDCNLLSTQIATLTHIASNWLNCGQEADRYGMQHPSIVPYQGFHSKDGMFYIGAGNNHLFADVCKILGLEDMITDERFSSNAKRVENRQTLVERFSQRFAEKSNKEWAALMEGCKFPYGPINNMEETFKDPQVQALGLVQEMEHHTLGTIRVPGPAVTYSESSTVLQRPPPTLGQHTDEVLASMLGLSAETIQQYRDKHIID